MAQEMSVNQVVAWNLWQERKARGWSWEDVSQRLAENGVSWEKATYYGIEASRLPDKPTRRFSADELLALARAFGTTISTFLTPPQGTTMVLHGKPVTLRDLVAVGIGPKIGDVSVLRERLIAALAALGDLEEGTVEQTSPSGAEQITDFLTSQGMSVDELARRRFDKDRGRLDALDPHQEMRELVVEAGVNDPADLLQHPNVRFLVAMWLDVWPAAFETSDKVARFIDEVRLSMKEEKGTA